jgi:hypothetical protein
MATLLVSTIATDREVCRMRKRGKDIKDSAGFRPLHFSPEPASETLPRLLVSAQLKAAHQLWRWREVGEPDVEPILDSVAPFGYAPRRTPDGTDAETFAARTRASKLHDSNCHFKLSVSPGEHRGAAARHWIGQFRKMPRLFNWHSIRSRLKRRWGEGLLRRREIVRGAHICSESSAPAGAATRNGGRGEPVAALENAPPPATFFRASGAGDSAFANVGIDVRSLARIVTFRAGPFTPFVGVRRCHETVGKGLVTYECRMQNAE